jgi:hypothetical protein
MQRLLRPSRVALVLGWFALWLGAVGYTYCAVPLAPASASSNVQQSGAFDYSRAPQHPRSDSDVPDCRQWVNASTVSQPAAPAPVSGDKTSNLTLPSAARSLALRGDDRILRYHLYPRPPGRPLYLRTLRLLI